MTRRWPPRILSFALWALLALSLVFWSSRLFGTSTTTTRAAAIAPPMPAVQAADIARLLGPGPSVDTPAAQAAAQPAPPAASTMRLLGVVANARRQGVALIAVDGQVARPYRVGSAVEGIYVLTAVSRRSATLQPKDKNSAALTLELAPVDGKTATTAAAPGVPSSVPALLRNLATAPSDGGNNNNNTNPPAATVPAAPAAAAANTQPASGSD